MRCIIFQSGPSKGIFSWLIDGRDLFQLPCYLRADTNRLAPRILPLRTSAGASWVLVDWVDIFGALELSLRPFLPRYFELVSDAKIGMALARSFGNAEGTSLRDQSRSPCVSTRVYFSVVPATTLPVAPVSVFCVFCTKSILAYFDLQADEALQ